MTCPCGNPSHDKSLFMEAQAREFIKGGDSKREVWRHWSDPNHKNYKGEPYMKALRAIIDRLREEAA